MLNKKLSHGEAYTGTNQKFPTGEEKPAYRGNKEYSGPVLGDIEEVPEEEVIETLEEEEIEETPEEEIEEGQDGIELEPIPETVPEGSFIKRAFKKKK